MKASPCQTVEMCVKDSYIIHSLNRGLHTFWSDKDKWLTWTGGESFNLHYVRCFKTHAKTSDTVTLEDESRIKRTEGGEEEKKSSSSFPIAGGLKNCSRKNNLRSDSISAERSSLSESKCYIFINIPCKALKLLSGYDWPGNLWTRLPFPRLSDCL